MELDHRHFGVTPEKAAALARRMEQLGLTEADIDESFVHGAGPGGQKVNKTANVVQLTHRPSGQQVTARSGRSRALNRFLARRRLCNLLEGEAGAKAQLQAKLRKQKQRRRRRSSSQRPDDA